MDAPLTIVDVEEIEVGYDESGELTYVVVVPSATTAREAFEAACLKIGYGPETVRAVCLDGFKSRGLILLPSDIGEAFARRLRDLLKGERLADGYVVRIGSEVAMRNGGVGPTYGINRYFANGN